jgi:site-specific DNA recombinase
MEKALLYVRVSTKEQEGGYSLDAQEKLGYSYAADKGLIIDKFWKVSESAWKQDRKYFMELIDYTKEYNIKNIIFDVPDRMTRNLYDLLKIDELVKQHDVTIHFSRANKIYNKNSDSSDELMLGVEALMARNYSNEISRKVKMGMNDKIEGGGYCHVAPVGYLNNTATHTIEIDPIKGPFIKKAFDMMASGNYSLTMMCDTLYEQGFRSKRGHRMRRGRMQDLLKNPVYYGHMIWHGKTVPADHTPIVSKAMFDRVQELTKKRPLVSSRQDKFPFNSLISCGRCGCRVIGGVYSKKHRLYACTFSNGRHENYHYIRESKLVEEFGKSLDKAIPPDDMLDYIVETVRKDSNTSQEYSENRLKNLYNDKKVLEGRLDRLYNDKLDNKITEAFWQSKNDDLKRLISTLETEIRDLGHKNPENLEKGLFTLEIMKSLKSQYKNGDLKEKAKIAKSAHMNCLYDGEKLSPVYRKPFDTFAEMGGCLEWRE